MTSDATLRSIHDLASPFQSLYSFKYFNVVQSDCFDVAYHSDASMVVAAPTGCGKTAVLELCMLRLFGKQLGMDGRLRRPNTTRAIYIAPTRSLVQEKVRDWKARFGSALHVRVSELTGDVENVRSQEIVDADVICATPEKFDAVSRKHQDHGGTRFFGEIGLVLIDEVHLLNEARGSVLEAGVVSRVRVVSKLAAMQQMPIANVRFAAVSATIPNAQDLADWLNVPPEGLLIYGEEVRPVKLTTIVNGYNETKNDFLFERRLNDYLYPVIAEYSKARPTLVFCSTRKGTSDTANHLISQITLHFPNRIGNPFVRDHLHMERLVDAARKASNKQLQQCLQHGIAFHHAGMDNADRSLVETAFYNQDILVLCTTGTLALGVNLPAHLVIIKGTRYYCGGQESKLDQSDLGKIGIGYKEYERGMCLQMIGRAGRPQFDTSGVAVIMTQRQNVERYEHLTTGCEELESTLPSCFAEYLNAEITLGTIKSIPLAVEWLKSTFMYIRATAHPVLYGMPKTLTQKHFDQVLTEKMIISNLRLLQKHKMVNREADGVTLTPLECGRWMAYYYIRLNTMIRICETPSRASIPDLMHIISKAEELETVRLRRSEKRILNDINCKRTNTSIKFQVLEGPQSSKSKQRITTSDEKIFILMNDALSDAPSDPLDSGLRQEIIQILKVAETIVRCMTRYYASVHCLAASANSRILLKCVKMHLWEDTAIQCRQLPNIGKLLSERLVKGGIGKLKQLSQADPRKIEAMTQKNFPFGNTLLQDLQKRYPPALKLEIIPIGAAGDGTMKIQLMLERQSEATLCQVQFMGCSLICGTLHDDHLLLNHSINLKSFESPYIVTLYTGRRPQKPLEIVASVIMEKVVGCDVTKKLVIPFDAQFHQWTSNHHQSDNAVKRETESVEGGVAEGVIQRLSVVLEPPKPIDTIKEKECRPISSIETPDRQPIAIHAPSVQSTKIGTMKTVGQPTTGPLPRSCLLSKTKKSKSARSFEDQKDLPEETSASSFLRTPKKQTMKSAVSGIEKGTPSTQWTTPRSVLESRDVNQKWETPNRSQNRWRQCLSLMDIHPSPKPTATPSTSSDAIRLVREKSNRSAVDWTTRARAIIEARHHPPVKETSTSNKRTRSTTSDRTSIKKPALHEHLGDSTTTGRLDEKEERAWMMEGTSPNARSTGPSYTESDTTSVFSFL